jgi:hypothetical protein
MPASRRCTEAYAVLAGRGAVQTLGPEGFREIPLEAGAFVWFTPGTIHRLVNADGLLEILVVMQNAGLPEAGDMVITFAPEVLDDPVAYADAHTLPAGEQTTTGSGEAARRRRAAAVDGFLRLRAAVEREGREATGRQLQALKRAEAPHLAEASVYRLPPPPRERRMGCCGTLGVYVADAAGGEH